MKAQDFHSHEIAMTLMHHFAAQSANAKKLSIFGTTARRGLVTMTATIGDRA